MRRALVLLVSFASTCAALAYGCRSFDDAPAPTSDGAAPDGPSSSEGGGDGAGPDGGDGGSVSCALGDTPTLLTTTGSLPSKLVSDGRNVYWVEADTTLMRLSLSDCSKKEIEKADGGVITALAASSDWVAWASGKKLHYTSAATDVVSIKSTDAEPETGLIVADGQAIWPSPSNNHIVSFDLAKPVATTVAVLVTTPRPLLAANAAKLFFFGLDPDGGTIVNLWWHLHSSFTPEVNGPLATQQTPALMTANSSRVFWTSDNEIRNALVGGGVMGARGSSVGVNAMVADDAFLYLAVGSTIQRIGSDSGGAFQLASGQVAPISLAVTPGAILWGTSDLKIMRMKKPPI